MAKYNLLYPKYCKITETEASDGTVTESLGAGAVFARAVKASVSFNTSKAKLFADGGLAESVNQFTAGTLSMDIDDLDDAIEADLTGETAGTSDHAGEYTLTDESTAPYVRFGYIAGKIVRHVKKYTVFGYYKLVLSIPNDDEETKGESINLSPTAVNGDIAANCEGKVRTKKTFNSLSDAVTFLNSFVNVSTSSNSNSGGNTGGTTGTGA